MITQDAYDALRSEQRKGESLSNVILRLVSKDSGNQSLSQDEFDWYIRELLCSTHET